MKLSVFTHYSNLSVKRNIISPHLLKVLDKYEVEIQVD